MEIMQKVKHLSSISLGFDFENYLTTKNKSIIIFEIDTIGRKYLLKEGQDFDDILKQSNERYFDSKAGYLVDIKSQLQAQMEADLLLLSDIVLNSDPKDLDTIIIHELIHMIIDSENKAFLKVSEYAKHIGSKIYGMTDYPNESMTKHTEDFCQQLAQACINYTDYTNNFSCGLNSLKSAMRYDIFED